jgi:ureidoglycolate lyase
MSERRALPVEPLTRAAFAPYGDLIDEVGVEPELLNAGTARKYAALATIETVGGPAAISLFHAAPRVLPIDLVEIERHPNGSQAFVPTAPTHFLVVVAGGADRPRPDDLRAFLATGRQGIQFHRGVWHHALLALEPCAFLVIDRKDARGNLETLAIADWRLRLAP